MTSVMSVAFGDREESLPCLFFGGGGVSGNTAILRYKTAEGKKENKFGFGGKPQGAAFARKIVDTGHKVSGGSNGPM